jgi:hypothetical protein
MGVPLRELEGARVLFAFLLPVFSRPFVSSNRSVRNSEVAETQGSNLHGKPDSSARSQEAQQVQNAVCLEFKTETLAQLKP